MLCQVSSSHSVNMQLGLVPLQQSEVTQEVWKQGSVEARGVNGRTFQLK